jgi:uncharacterized phage protein gp47/JayE
MIELDGRQFTIKTAAENTQDMLNSINSYCAEHDVRNSKGELVMLEARMSSPIYCILWALGYLVTAIQNLIYSVGTAHNVQASSDAQLLNLAQLANVKRRQPSLTTIRIEVIAKSPLDTEYAADIETCTITSEDTITVNNIIFKPALYPQIVLAPGQSASITLVAQQAGSFNIAANSITQFDAPIINLKRVLQPLPAIPGQQLESIASLRTRMQRRQLSGTTMDTAMDAINGLPGVTLCNIFYNTALVADPTSAQYHVGDDTDYVLVPPRWALIMVQGYNKDIAKTYFSFMTAQTIGWTELPSGEIELNYSNISIAARKRILEVQIYETRAHQKLPVLLMNPRMKPVYVQVFIATSIVSSIEQQMKEAVCTLGLNLTAGQSVTSAQILATLKDFSSYQVVGATVSSDEGLTYSYKTLQAADLLWTFNTLNITINMPGVLS